MAQSAESFDRLVASVARPMLVVTTVAGIARAGCLVGFHCQCSIEPPQYAVWLSRANRTFEVAIAADVFAVHFLDDADRSLAELFGTVSGDDADKFAQCSWHPGPGGVPLLDACTARMAMTRVAMHNAGGDHACFVLAPRSVEVAGSLRPLESTSVDDLVAGHPTEERREPH